MFSKDLYCRHIKPRACLGKGSEEAQLQYEQVSPSIRLTRKKHLLKTLWEKERMQITSNVFCLTKENLHHFEPLLLLLLLFWKTLSIWTRLNLFCLANVYGYLESTYKMLFADHPVVVRIKHSEQIYHPDTGHGQISHYKCKWVLSFFCTRKRTNNLITREVLHE